MIDAPDHLGQNDEDAGSEDLESLLFKTVGPEAAPKSSDDRRSSPAVTAPASQGPIGMTEFGEEAYCEAYPDIPTAIHGGLLDSAAGHFRRHGRHERRLSSGPYLRALIGPRPEVPASNIGFSVDALIMSQSGVALVVGWIDDRNQPLRSVSVIRGLEGLNTRIIGRCRRPDVDALLNAVSGYGFGFWAVLPLDVAEPRGTAAKLRARLVDGTYIDREMQAGVVSDSDLRDTILGHFAALQYYGNRDIEAFANLDLGLGQLLTNFNRSVTGAITAAAHAEHYGPRRDKYKASLIICLFGKIEYFFLQNALFSGSIGIEDYEFIYVSNSPELAESLNKEAKIAELIYGLSITLVTLPGNGGFSAANNVAVRFASSDRVIFVNPDVFPRDRDWTQKHEMLLNTLPREHTAIFGVPLYYDDGSLMHGGMFFEVDHGLSVKPNGIASHSLLRVEHYGKGAPEWSDKYTRSRRVSAVTGAFISVEREWFQALGGFTEDYIFGHYEDADLCLKSLRQGVPVWLHDIRFWHLEGKGSVRRPPHEGGSMVNRWLFTRRWGETIADGLAGPAPAHPLLSTDDTSIRIPMPPPGMHVFPEPVCAPPEPEPEPPVMQELAPPAEPVVTRTSKPDPASKNGAGPRAKRSSRTTAGGRHG